MRELPPLRPLATGLLMAAGLMAVPCGARSEPPSNPEISVLTYTVGDGLPSSHILDLEQDDTGRLWILNRLGVTLYDGRDFESFSEGLSSTRLGALALDDHGAHILRKRRGLHPYL